MEVKEAVKLNQKLAEWAGFIFEEGIDYAPWHYPGQDDSISHELLPPFTEKFDACIKWLIPKLDSTVNIRSIKFYVIDSTVPPNVWACEIIFFLGEPDDIYARRASSIPLAFCLAVEKFIDTYEVKE